MVSIIGDPQPIAPGEALVQELLWVHDMLRRDLRAVRQLAERVAAGEIPAHVEAEVAALQTNSALWKFRVNCMYYCRFVHGHHSLEDQALFPALRRTNPALGPVVAKLEADHRTVAGYLDEVEAVVRDLGKADNPANRERVVAALNGLAEHLLAHLTYEEESIAPTMRAWRGWPPA